MDSQSVVRVGRHGQRRFLVRVERHGQRQFVVRVERHGQRQFVIKTCCSDHAKMASFCWQGCWFEHTGMTHRPQFVIKADAVIMHR